MSKPTMRDLFERPDQGRVRADLALFFGPRAEAYLRVYDKMRERSRNWVMSWSWPGFFTPIVWLFYRKLYLYGALCTVIPLAIALAFDLSAGSGIAVVIALSAKAWYVSAGLQHIGKADQLELLGAERSDYLRRVGGVSPAAGWLVGLVHAALAALLIVHMIEDSSATIDGDSSLGHSYTLSAAAPR